MKHSDYPDRCTSYHCIDTYRFPDDIRDWLECPYCNLKPKIWTFDNGRSTVCGCSKNYSEYDHWSIYAESIMSVHKRCNGNTGEYSCDDLRKNWNHWCTNGEILFDRNYDKDGRW